MTDTGMSRLILLNLVLLAVLLSAGILLIRYMQNRRLKKDVPPDGTGLEGTLFRQGIREVDAEIVGITRNLRMEGQNTWYYVVCRYTDQKTGLTANFTSRPLINYPGKNIIGKTAHVTIHSGESGDYTVDLEGALKDGT